MQKRWVETKYGEAPFYEVKIVRFNFSCSKNSDDVAFAQYNLLLNENILQLHLEGSTCKGVAVTLNDFELGDELKKAGLTCSNFSEQKIKYEELLQKNNLF